MFSRLMFVASLISFVVLAVMVNLTTPSGVGPLGVLVFFTMVYVVVLEIVLIVVKILYSLMGKKMGRRGYYQAAVIAFGPIMLLLVQSFGPIQLWKVAAIILFVFLGCFVVNKRT